VPVAGQTVVRTLGELVDALGAPDDPPAGIRHNDAGLAGQRILVISSLPTHYRVPLFDQVSARLAAAAAAFRVLFLAQGRADRESWMETGNPSYEHVFARSAFPLIREIGRRVPLDLTRRLEEFDPTLIVVGGLAIPVAGRTAVWARRRGISFGVWSGETMITAGQRSRPRRAGRRRVAQAASFALSYGSASADYLLALNPNLPVVHARNTTVVRNSAQRATRPVRVLSVGRAFPGKGFDILIQALRRRPELDCSLRLVGDGPELPRLKELAAGDQRVEFIGAVRSSDILDVFADADVFVFPSQIDVFGLLWSRPSVQGLPP
jgi:glycosyltransferase involved in cell wall biosynthesis